MIRPYCDIPLEIRVHVEEEIREYRKLFRMYRERTGFYRIQFLDGPDRSYRSGDLCYQLESLSVPITGEMLDCRMIYVKTDTAPELKPKNPGLRVVKEASVKA